MTTWYHRQLPEVSTEQPVNTARVRAPYHLLRESQGTEKKYSSRGERCELYASSHQWPDSVSCMLGSL